jgi:magnesium-transporting ATPase (P-type)
MRTLQRPRSGPAAPAQSSATVSAAGAGALARTALLDAGGVLAELRTGHEGLSAAEAEARLGGQGPNLLPQPRGPSLARQLFDQMFHFFAVMLWIASGLAFVGRMPQLGVAIIAVIVFNGLFSFAQEYRAERAIRTLSALLPETATVRRDGRKTRVPSAELVPGDLVLLAEGDRISADARVIRSAGLKADNSMLTGESEPVLREDAALDRLPVDIADAGNLVFAGTFVTSGSATVVVAATGPRTRLGAISELTGAVVRRPTPLRVQLNQAVRVIASFAVAAGVALFGVSLLLGERWGDGFLFAVGVIVALVPEGLLPTLSLSLSMSATRMAKRGALVRRLESVETLGATTVICSDKTGTITANEMTARAIAIRGHHYTASGSGYGPGGTLLANGRPLQAAELALVAPLLRVAALCNDARIEQQRGRWRCAGDPTEGALLILARKGGIERADAERSAHRVREFPFESARQRMSTLHTLPSGALELLAKGAPEAIMRVCTRFRQQDQTLPLEPAIRAAVQADVERLAADGLRVLAFARCELPGPELPSIPDAAEDGLELLGLVGMADPVRPEVPDAMARCQRAGIRVVMITGDHPATAGSVAEAAGLRVGRVILGSELPEDDQELAKLLADPGVSVLARVAPESKLRIAKALQSLGEVVAMTGDGVNDAPALRQADIGVAMGVVGTDVAREAADFVLLDDNFAHIVQAVEEGRAAFDNIKRFLTYHLTDNVAELTPFVVWALSAGRIPLMITVLQVLALDIGTDILPALALGAERPEPGVMERPPRSRQARLLDRRVLGRAFGFLGPVEATLSMSMLPLGAAVFFDWPARALPRSGTDKLLLSTMVFASIALMQMAVALQCRGTPGSLASIRPFSNRLLNAALLVELLALSAFVYAPPVYRILGQHPLNPSQWIPILIAPWLLLLAEELRKLIVRRHAARRTRPA